MVEELHRDSISDRLLASPNIEETVRFAQQLERRDVFDVNGVRMGRVTRCFGDDEGHLERAEITLDKNAMATLGADENVAVLRPGWIADVAEDGVHLSLAGEQIVRPEDPRPITANPDERGAPELPRKER